MTTEAEFLARFEQEVLDSFRAYLLEYLLMPAGDDDRGDMYFVADPLPTEIDWSALDPGYLGSGQGVALARAAIEWFENGGADRSDVLVSYGRVRAMRFIIDGRETLATCMPFRIVRKDTDEEDKT